MIKQDRYVNENKRYFLRSIDLSKHPGKKNSRKCFGQHKSVYLRHKKAGRLDNHLLGLLDRSHEKTLYTLVPFFGGTFFYLFTLNLLD